MFKALVATILISSPALAFTPKQLLSFELKSAPRFCHIIREERRQWGKEGAIPPANQSRARELFGVCNAIGKEFPEPLLKTFDEALKTDLQDSVAWYMAVSDAGCAMECLALADDLIKAKQNIKPELLRFLKKAKLPSLLTIKVEVRTIELGEEAKLWRLKATDRDALKEIKTMVKKAEEAMLKTTRDSPELFPKQVSSEYEAAKPEEKRIQDLVRRLR